MAITPVASTTVDDDELSRLIDTHRWAVLLDDPENTEFAGYLAQEPEADYLFCQTATDVAGLLIRDYHTIDDEEAAMRRAEMSESIAFAVRRARFNEAMETDPEFAQMAESSDDLVTAYNSEDAVVIDGQWPDDLPALMVSTASYSEGVPVPEGNVDVIDPFDEVSFIRGMATSGFITLKENTDAEEAED